MKSLGMAGSPLPRARVSDFEMALQLLTIFGNDKARKQGMTELRDEKAAAVKAREDAEAAGRKAAERDKAAQAAEADATLARQALADESAAATTAHAERETAVAERERLATEAEHSQGLRDKELVRREVHLHEAGVAGF